MMLNTNEQRQNNDDDDAIDVERIESDAATDGDQNLAAAVVTASRAVEAAETAAVRQGESGK